MSALRSEGFMRHAMAAHGSSVYLVALAQTRSEHDAQDVAQDVFCRLLTDATAFTCDEHLRAWLLRVTVNRCRELHRMPWRRRVDALDERTELPSPDVGTEDAALTELRADPVWQALRQLPEKLRVVALLHYVEEYSTEQIARIVGCAPTTVRTRLHRARKRMRQILEPDLEGEEGHHEQAGIRPV
ncbi:MAG TPA: RNA polymerase sigma factor [Candidatus Olsenella pullicola]|nr:RNA polymerase sigma factor [Candidatus Olsenella pullicola]